MTQKHGKKMNIVFKKVVIGLHLVGGLVARVENRPSPIYYIIFLYFVTNMVLKLYKIFMGTSWTSWTSYLRLAFEIYIYIYIKKINDKKYIIKNKK